MMSEAEFEEMMLKTVAPLQNMPYEDQVSELKREKLSNSIFLDFLAFPKAERDNQFCKQYQKRYRRCQPRTETNNRCGEAPAQGFSGCPCPASLTCR